MVEKVEVVKKPLSKLKKIPGPLVWNQDRTKGAEWAVLFSKHMDVEQSISAFGKTKVLVGVLSQLQLSFELDDYHLSQDIMTERESAAALEKAYTLLRNYFVALQALTPAENHVFRMAAASAYGVDRGVNLVPLPADLKEMPNFEKFGSVRAIVGLGKGRPSFLGALRAASFLIGFWEKLSGQPADYKKGDMHILKFVSDVVDLHFRPMPGKQDVPLLASAPHIVEGKTRVETISVSTLRDELLAAVKELIKTRRNRTKAKQTN